MYTDEFGKLWLKFTKEMKIYMETRLMPALTEGQFHVLEFLVREEKMKPSDFVAHVNTTPAAITTLLDRMEKNGLIIRERDDVDRRIVWVIATAKGRSECHRGIQVREDFLKARLNQISAHNQKLLIYLLGKVAND